MFSPLSNHTGKFGRLLGKAEFQLLYCPVAQIFSRPPVAKIVQSTLFNLLFLLPLENIYGSVLGGPHTSVQIVFDLFTLGYLVLNPPWARSENVGGVVLAPPLLYYSISTAISEDRAKFT
jgi:hypothetical protein